MSDNNESRPSQDQPDSDTTGYPQLARVVGHLDNTYNGKIQVELLRTSGNTISESQVQTVKMISPFFGFTSNDYLTDNEDFGGTQKSYGMWMIPPDVGSIVVVIFINGNSKDGYWIGGVPMGDMNFMTPGLAATSFNIDGTEERVPVGEFNKNLNPDPGTDTTRIPKPAHPLATVLENQGLLLDDIRGITSSSSRRETPSMVFGISTPGPLDKQPDAPRGKIGTKESSANVPVSRLGGTTFVMDDGDDKYIRKTPAGGAEAGPSEYISVEEDGPGDGDVTIPHNELFRIRTRTGHQILMHNSEDLIYITNARGTAWIELTSDGKIDIYAKDSISVRTQNDLNFYADRDINMEAGRNFNLKVAERHQTEVGMDKICIVNGNVVLQTDGTHDETVTGQVTLSTDAGYTITATDNFQVKAGGTDIDGGNINLNSGNFGGAAANVPDPLETIDSPTEVEGETITSIMARIPTTEPYPHHENLDASLFTPDATDREAVTAIEVPPTWKIYTTTTDTFDRPPAPATEEEQQEAGE